MNALYLLLLLLGTFIIGSPTTSGTELRDPSNRGLDVQRRMTAAEAALYWRKTGQIHPEFVRVNEANIDDSNYAQWYIDTVTTPNEQNSDGYTQLGETVLFAQVTAGISNLKCTITGGCSLTPDCKDIVSHVQAQVDTQQGYWGSDRSNITLVEALDFARKIYFALLSFCAITRYYNTVYLRGNGYNSKQCACSSERSRERFHLHDHWKIVPISPPISRDRGFYRFIIVRDPRLWWCSVFRVCILQDRSRDFGCAS
ncbi:hypothetical protein N431DRAFT_161458 [Stipitochalara longipes BDJ]|nr:hypothetical protein N431DRAFT_161458 [Stipitochalara longipes BDJ]